jgi:hypothetical protein
MAEHLPLPPTNWPKPWLFQLHAEAVRQGFVWVQPITEADARSLRARAYRARRRSDKSMAAFIPPEYHLVIFGAWEEGPNGAGRLPVIYNARPDGVPLPQIIPAAPTEALFYTELPEQPSAPPIDLSPDKLHMEPDEIARFITELRKKAKERPA